MQEKKTLIKHFDIYNFIQKAAGKNGTCLCGRDSTIFLCYPQKSREAISDTEDKSAV
jgi:hypothetical protein